MLIRPARRKQTGRLIGILHREAKSTTDDEKKLLRSPYRERNLLHKMLCSTKKTGITDALRDY